MTAKRLFDLLIAIPGLVCLSPLFLLAALWIRLDSPGPVFFRQERVGRFGRPFRIYKFRTMCLEAESKGKQLTVGDDPRITGSGAFLRRYKLDELPQLINVITGEMSLVGPRPEVPRYVAFYPAHVRDVVLSVPPGITDFASIEYRDENSLLAGADDPEHVYLHDILPVKLDYYCKYVTERSLMLDFRLILLTLKKIL
jgi:lipopolysaccharide/colanic/teichoic acid biosynthesis glycosyltransferase